MRKVMIFFAICVLTTGIFAQNKGDDAQPQFSREPTGTEITKPNEPKQLPSVSNSPTQPQFSREPTGTELVKPIQTEPLPSSLTNSEMQAWDMIFRALEKDPASKSFQAKEPPSSLPTRRQGNDRGVGLSKTGGDAFVSSRGQGRRPESSANSAKGESTGKGIRGLSNQGFSHGESAENEVEIEIKDNDDRGGLPANRPPGWDVGKKEGWKGGNVPPGLDTPPGLRKQNRKRGRNEK